ncbi:hypothetical protein DFQ28_003044 [Apophysomyces sp. BC1034]|nr:hypothetical protein DFQ28_003044 [Apophysomyces sp. BC1034]
MPHYQPRRVQQDGYDTGFSFESWLDENSEVDVAVLPISQYARPIAAAATAVAALAWLGACAPIAGPHSAATPTVGTAPAAPSVSGVDGAGPAGHPASNGGVRDIVVGGEAGYHVTLKMMPPVQVCDADAFVDGVRAGYVTTWNGLVAASGGGSPGGAVRRPVFDSGPVERLDERYRLRWKGGPEPVNACAAYGYQIGKVMGTRQAYVDARGTS